MSPSHPWLQVSGIYSTYKYQPPLNIVVSINTWFCFLYIFLNHPYGHKVCMQFVRLRKQIWTFSKSQPKHNKTSQMESFVWSDGEKKNYDKCILKLVLMYYIFFFFTVKYAPPLSHSSRDHCTQHVQSNQPVFKCLETIERLLSDLRPTKM